MAQSKVILVSQQIFTGRYYSIPVGMFNKIVPINRTIVQRILNVNFTTPHIPVLISLN